MAEREVKIGLASYIKADSPVDHDRLEPQWGFGLFGQTVDVHVSDVDRFDRLNSPATAPIVPLPDVAPVNDLTPSEPPRSGRGSGLESWMEYAANLGLLVDSDATRDDIIALVDDSK